MKISAVVLTKNEEKNIEKCLRSVSFCDETIVIDDCSTDNTLKKIRNKFKIQIFQKKLNNDFAAQRNFGLSKTNNEWVLFVDADEQVSEELKKEIILLFTSQNSKKGLMLKKIDAFYLRRRDYFWNQELKFGEVKKVWDLGIVRLVKKVSGQFMGSVHEVFHTTNRVGQLNGFLNHYPHPTLKKFINNINNYSSIRAEELFNRGRKTNVFEIIFFPFGKFIYNYFLNFGFLDGSTGFTYAFMMSFHSFLVRTKLFQLTRQKIIDS